jgi:methylenetetrahydrofolate dehydrogenase (NADP+)/methenyltetrahydrofolate cyclohydrolase
VNYILGTELAAYIKERHRAEVKKLLKKGITPKLAIIQVKDDPVIDTYVRMKKRYGEDLGAEVDIHKVEQSEVADLVAKLNDDVSVKGMIIQLPLHDVSQTDELVAMVDPEKDVDALGPKSKFTPATPTAILWLLSGNNIELKGKHVLLVGRGKLVGGPLEKMLVAAGIDLHVAVKGDPLEDMAKKADVIISAAPVPRILKSSMVKTGAAVVDAGTANEEGKTVGNADEELYERGDIRITPHKGGVGPLTVCALFENLIQASSR